MRKNPLFIYRLKFDFSFPKISNRANSNEQIRLKGGKISQNIDYLLSLSIRPCRAAFILSLGTAVYAFTLCASSYVREFFDGCRKETGQQVEWVGKMRRRWRQNPIWLKIVCVPLTWFHSRGRRPA